MTDWQAATRRELRALASSCASSVQASAKVALAAAITSGLPLYVPRCTTLPSATRLMCSARPPKAPTGKPPPIDLASVIRSGWTPKTPLAPP